MKKGVLIVVILLVLAVIGIFFVFRGNYGGSSDKNPVNSASSSSVLISNFDFSPKTISIKQGESMTWTNNDNAPHTVTSDSGSELSSQTLGKGESYSHTFNQKGTFDYHCNFHTNMKGTIVVE